jgi:hypothetical protein
MSGKDSPQKGTSLIASTTSRRVNGTIDHAFFTGGGEAGQRIRSIGRPAR